MNFNLKKPCADCPFRVDRDLNYGWLGEHRAKDIAQTLDDNAFSCHKTTTHDDESEHIPNKKEQHCYGALVVLQNEDVFFDNKMMRIAAMYGLIDKDAVFKSDLIVKDRQQFIEMHSKD